MSKYFLNSRYFIAARSRGGVFLALNSFLFFLIVVFIDNSIFL